jgi:hypothetical protein
MYELFKTVAGIYQIMTQSTLSALNNALNLQADQENQIAHELAKYQRVDHPSHADIAHITLLKQQQANIQMEISATQAAQSSVTSGAATFANILNQIVSSVQSAMQGVVQNF